MKRSERLASIIRISDSEEQKAAREYAKSRQNLEQNQKKLTELQQYRDDFYKGINQGDVARNNASHLMGYQGFLSQVNNAIESQKKMIEKTENNTEIMRNHWLKKRMRKQSMERAKENISQTENKVQLRKEQKRIEEFIQSNYAMKNKE